jgi:SAM-dependent methyltransferase
LKVAKNPYDEAFYINQRDTSLISAENIVPTVVDYIKPQSVIDVGCGVGTWPSVFSKFGVDSWGIDGAYVKEEMLKINKDHFIVADLEQELNIGRRFDLAISLEVAEHLSVNRMRTFVKDLINLSDVVLFSCAIPGQGGTHHINERWQSEWVKLFSEYQYTAIDCIRPVIWNNENISVWYRQNIILFCFQDIVANYDKLSIYMPVWDIIHPEFFAMKTNNYSAKIKRFFKRLKFLFTQCS